MIPSATSSLSATAIAAAPTAFLRAMSRATNSAAVAAKNRPTSYDATGAAPTSPTIAPRPPSNASGTPRISVFCVA